MSTVAAQEVALNDVARDIHKTACDKGFWEPPPSFLAEINTKLMLIVSEVAEAQDALRTEYPDTPASGFSKMTPNQEKDFRKELADIVIRTLDLSEYFGWNMGDTILAKMAENEKRSYMHSKRF